MEITANITEGHMYWGGQPLPEGYVIAGTVRRGTGDTGALLTKAGHPSLQGNAGTIRSLPRLAGGRPRKPVAEKRTRVVKVSLSEDEHHQLEARAAGVPLAKYLRDEIFRQ